MFGDLLFDTFIRRPGICRHCGQRKSLRRSKLCDRCYGEVQRAERYRKESFGSGESNGRTITETDESLHTQNVVFQLIGASLFLAATSLFLGKFTFYGLPGQTGQTKMEAFLGGLAVLLVIAVISRKLLGFIIKWTLILSLVAFAIGMLGLCVHFIATQGVKH